MWIYFWIILIIKEPLRAIIVKINYCILILERNWFFGEWMLTFNTTQE